MAKDKRMTKQVRVYSDTAHAIAVIASTLSQQQGKEVTFAEVVEQGVKDRYPELYQIAMSTLKTPAEKKPSKD